MGQDSDLRATAYHEAGHTVMAFTVGRAVKHVTIIPDENDGSSGSTTYRSPVSLYKLNLDLGLRARHTLEKCIMTALAGPEAESRVSTASTDCTDTDEVSSCVGVVCNQPNEQTPYREWLRLRVVNTLNVPSWWQAVEDVARELQEKRQISGRTARRVIEDAVSPRKS